MANAAAVSSNFQYTTLSHPDVETYLAAMMAGLQPWSSEVDTLHQHASPPALAERLFDELTSRDYCYLSKSRVAPYRASALALLEQGIRSGQPIPLYLDLGGGYHASIRTGFDDLVFDVGLGELMVLGQMASFARRAERLYRPGVRFHIVIDNLCALLVNDIPLANTTGYCARLRRLIQETGLSRLVGVMVESELLSIADFHLGSENWNTDGLTLGWKDRDNVERFLGRHCDEHEAAERIVKYKRILDLSDGLLERFIHGVHMTQRASASTLCFRAFPGADSRIQSGEVVLGRNPHGRIYPFLLTSRGVDAYRCTRARYPGLLPPMLSGITYAERLHADPGVVQ